MKINSTIGLTAATLLLLGGCASNKSFTTEQKSIINKHTIAVEALPADTEEELMVLTKSSKVGAEVGGAVVFGLLTGGISFGSSDGNTPRDRLSDDSVMDLMTSSSRKASAEKIKTITPTQIMQTILEEKFETVLASKKDNRNKLVISTKPVAWHLYYNDLFNGEDTFVLEYASDIELNLESAKLRRTFSCDDSSKKALSKKEWLANDSLRLRNFANNVATECVKKILLELAPAPTESAMPVEATPAATTPTAATTATVKLP